VHKKLRKDHKEKETERMKDLKKNGSERRKIQHRDVNKVKHMFFFDV
jgi:hypothetical protein